MSCVQENPMQNRKKICLAGDRACFDPLHRGRRERREQSHTRQKEKQNSQEGRNSRRQPAGQTAVGTAHGRRLEGNGPRSQLHLVPRQTGIGFSSLKAFWRTGSKQLQVDSTKEHPPPPATSAPSMSLAEHARARRMSAGIHCISNPLKKMIGVQTSSSLLSGKCLLSRTILTPDSGKSKFLSSLSLLFVETCH